jgi:hypothetical protein
MNQPMNLETTTLAVRNLTRPATAECGFFFVALALALFALSPAAEAVKPAPDGGYSNNNTDQPSKINCGTTPEGVSSGNRATAEANRSPNYESSESERPTRTQQAGTTLGG